MMTISAVVQYLYNNSAVEFDDLNNNRQDIIIIPDNFTSQPLQIALDATPIEYRNDNVINIGRQYAKNNNCTYNTCLIQFPSSIITTTTTTTNYYSNSSIGIILYSGGWIDPRSYSPIAKLIYERYTFPVVIPIYYHDLAINDYSNDCSYVVHTNSNSSCVTNKRFHLAKQAFPNVQKWIFVGHSLGALAASNEFWYEWTKTTTTTTSNNSSSAVGGLVMLAGDVQGSTNCGNVNYNKTNIPMATLIGSNDLIVNRTRYNINKYRLSNNTLYINITGGTHKQFGSYNDTTRHTILHQPIEYLSIPYQAQWEITIAAIYHVASQLLLDDSNDDKQNIQNQQDIYSNNNNDDNSKNNPTIRITSPRGESHTMKTLTGNNSSVKMHYYLSLGTTTQLVYHCHWLQSIALIIFLFIWILTKKIIYFVFHKIMAKK